MENGTNTLISKYDFWDMYREISTGNVYTDCYEAALEIAGMKILHCKYFGSYQGEWYAYGEYEGKYGWVVGSYGSCGGCDSWQAEFDRHWDHTYEDWFELVKDFGAAYLPLQSSDSVVEAVNKNCSTSIDSDPIKDWVIEVVIKTEEPELYMEYTL